MTGISEYALTPYWPTYGAAILEAGLSPNVLQGALDDATVLTRFVELTAELGRVPTSNELRHERARDPSFPSLGVFARLGPKNERIRRALDFCREDQALAHVVPLLEAVYSPDTTPDEPSPNASIGFVYLVEGHAGEYKIGRTNLVDRRLVELGVSAAVAPKLVHTIQTDDPAGIEAYWHARFADKRMRGEWFGLTRADVAAFRRWRKIA